MIVTSSAKPTIGCVLNDPRFTFWSILRHGARLRATDHGVVLLDYAAGSVEVQADMISDLLRRRVNALLVGPAHETRSFAAYLELARAARVPVIEVDGGILEGYVSATVRSDEHHGLLRLAELLVEHLGDRFRMALIAGPQNRRVDLMIDTLQRWPGIRIVGTATGDWTREGGRMCTARFLHGGDTIDAIFAANDAMALGVIDALEAAGLSDRITVVGYDGLPEAFRAIHAGRLLATVDQEPLQIGSVAIDLALRALRGEASERHVYTPGTLITRENVTEAALKALDLLPGIMHDLVESNTQRQQLQDEIIAAQQSTIRELSTPIIPIDDRTLIVPLIGAIDSARATQMTQTILQAISDYHADAVIIDITGIAVIDTGVANHLVQTAQAANLLGARVTLAGMSPEVAQTIVQLGVNLAQLSAQSSLRAALEALHRTRNRA